ncbi:hypothetical protein NEK97_13130 [Paenarthrobacter sp. UW852]|uniref:hypothetical protein n=1 Tax=Paenarthrobacter sp. UW852 TaxID=2951989 RepID=UPI002147414B|nr:hypothetical protein [Paenarthrobacter sp. UW852]MCR1162407.1 hypothetical protein [Paenarthrobacter sp. UW852]
MLVSVSLAMAVALAISSCSGAADSPITPDPSGKVNLDYENSLIVFPVDSYEISARDRSQILLAREVIMTTCMKKFGFIDDPNAAYPRAENRNFGVWNVDRVRQHGFRLIGEDSQSNRKHDEAGAWGDARYECLASEKSKIDEITPPDDLMNGGTAAEIALKSLSMASETSAWKAAKDNWDNCISAAGLTPGRDAATAMWSSQQSFDLQVRTDQQNPSKADAAEGIRIATIEAECNQEVRLTQTLGDIQASYQLPLIRQNEAVLIELKKKSQKYVDAAEKLLKETQ